jgi:hypothetical protein
MNIVLRGTPPDGAKGGIRIAQRELCDPWEPMETRRSGYFLVVKTSLPHESKKTEKGSLHPPMRKRSSKQNKNGGLGGESCAWRKGQVTSRNSTPSISTCLPSLVTVLAFDSEALLLPDTLAVPLPSWSTSISSGAGHGAFCFLLLGHHDAQTCPLQTYPALCETRHDMLNYKRWKRPRYLGALFLRWNGGVACRVLGSHCVGTLAIFV